MPANPQPKIRVLTRRTGLANTFRDLFQPMDPLLEIADVFRVDVIAEAFEMPDFEGHVRFIFNQGEDWRPPTPQLDYSDDDDIPLRRSDLINFDKVFADAWWMVLFAQQLPEHHLEDLVSDNQWTVWWTFYGHPEGYQSLFTRAGILELRERHRSLPLVEQHLILDAFDIFAVREDYKTLLRMVPFADDLVSTTRFFADNLIPKE